MTDNRGIQIEVIWWDNDVLKCQVTCSNQYFSGRANIYCSHSAPAEIVAALSGFLSNMRDSRTLELGTFNSNYAEGGVRLHFYCLIRLVTQLLVFSSEATFPMRWVN